MKDAIKVNKMFLDWCDANPSATEQQKKDKAGEFMQLLIALKSEA